MFHDDRPALHMRKIEDLRPTQMTVGLREVRRKVDEWQTLGAGKERAFLGDHMIPVVIGAKDRAYIIDNHHLARALHEAGLKKVLVQPILHLAHLPRDAFWHFLDCRNYLYLYDAEGRRRAPSDLPKSVSAMPDNPFRSLAGDLRRVGGYAKDPTPYSEFLWAEFLHRSLRRPDFDAGYDALVARALKLARSQSARHLPGWCGPDA